MTSKCITLGSLVLGYVLLLQIGCREQAKSQEVPSLTPTESERVLREPASTRAFDWLSPRITFDKLAYDFGEVPPNSAHIGLIKFTNTGQALLKITKVGRCCGVVARLDKGKTEYTPGESGAVKVEWRLTSLPGAFTRKLVVCSNDPVNPEVTLNIYAKTVLRITWEPRRLRLSPVQENAGCPELTISSLDGRPFSITAFKSTGDCVTADFDTSTRATKHVLQPKVKIEKLQKNASGRISISTTHPEGGTATVVFAVLQEYTIAPPSIMVFNAEPGKSITKKFVVLNNYGRNFEIESVSSKNKAVAIEVLDKAKIHNGYRFEIRMRVPPAAGRARFTDEFSVNLKGGEKLPIECSGYYPRNSSEPQMR